MLGVEGAATAAWEYLLDNYTEYQIHSVWSIIFHMAVFWPLCLLYRQLDLRQAPAFLYKYKIQKRKVVTKEEYNEAFKRALINQGVAFLLASALFYVQQRIGWGVSFSRELPSAFTYLWHLVPFVLVEEFFFFYSHYIFHNKLFYKPIHKFHHNFTAPVAVACVYAHPLEHVVANLLPLLLGPILMQAHVTEMWLWLTIGIVSTINSHSGFDFPFTPDARKHDFHHEAFNYNYGALGILDYLHGTSGSRDPRKK
mmetsp:Transcript_13974/g.55125  ORF Transcript_13974/g.55125 Transcript_13974/m.55125 type:complete len:254 (-) Transcript_13974:58-819(-)